VCLRSFDLSLNLFLIDSLVSLDCCSALPFIVWAEITIISWPLLILIVFKSFFHSGVYKIDEKSRGPASRTSHLSTRQFQSWLRISRSLGLFSYRIAFVSRRQSLDRNSFTANDHFCWVLTERAWKSKEESKNDSTGPHLALFHSFQARHLMLRRLSTILICAFWSLALRIWVSVPVSFLLLLWFRANLRVFHYGD
jgi:hypothetical protein